MFYAVCDSFDHSVVCHSTSDDQGRTPSLFETEELAKAAILDHDMDRAAAGMEPRDLVVRAVRLQVK